MDRADQSHDDFLAPRPPDPFAPKPDPEAKPEPLVRVRVADWTQVNLDGKVYAGGQELLAPASLAGQWIEAGWVTPVAAIAKAKSKGKASLEVTERRK